MRRGEDRHVIRRLLSSLTKLRVRVVRKVWRTVTPGHIRSPVDVVHGVTPTNVQTFVCTIIKGNELRWRHRKQPQASDVHWPYFVAKHRVRVIFTFDFITHSVVAFTTTQSKNAVVWHEMETTSTYLRHFDYCILLHFPMANNSLKLSLNSLRDIESQMFLDEIVINPQKPYEQ